MRPRVFLDLQHGEQPLGRVIFELFNDEVPRTCENFRALCTGEKGLSTTGIPLYYKGCTSHRIIKDFMIQAGDFTKRNGQGGESVYGATPFADEDLSRPVDAEGLLCMANKGPNTNGSQFFITLRECPHLNGKHVVFGRVIRGYDEVVLKLGDVPVDEKSRPLSPVIISNCGELELRQAAKPARPVSPEEEEPRRRSKRSASPDSDEPRRHRKKSKRKKEKDVAEEVTPAAPVGETEEEYDARLEREENERIEAAKKKELARIKEKYEKDIETNGGVRLKGRGRMMYVDPGTCIYLYRRLADNCV
ncbi:cyclophilin-like domain-containing protein [Roridomyces roridus]|uniref:peptidylprolyl isomerase n=1 Tax=Roridomyces roridus TaxID=1738132 RepID=A0AAD7CJL7_9AGAR|nr:cyclophilin-like domain-containing protein [Roridomyces roridus]